MIRPTRRAVLIFAAGVPLALLVIAYDAALWPLSFDYGILVLIITATDALLAFPRRLLAARVTVPASLYIGDPGAVTVAIAPTRFRRMTRFELLAEQRGALDPPAIAAGALASGVPLEVALPIIARRRGRVWIDRIWLRWQGPMALVEITLRHPVDRTIDIVPNLRAVRGAALRFSAEDAIHGLKLQQQTGEGAEFEALRDYAAGRDPRHIDWKHSARHKKLVCKEFRTERNHQVLLAFDTGYLMREPVDGLPRLDHAITAGLALAYVSLRGGDLVGAFGFDAVIRQYLGPSRGIAAFPRLLRAAAALDYHHQETNFTLGLAELGVRLKRRALIVLFTDFVDTVTAELLIESLGRAASRHAVVFVSFRDSLLRRAVDAAPGGFQDIGRAVIAHDLLRDREIVLERLERLGVHCLDVPSRGLSAALLNRYLMIKRRGLI